MPWSCVTDKTLPASSYIDVERCPVSCGGLNVKLSVRQKEREGERAIALTKERERERDINTAHAHQTS